MANMFCSIARTQFQSAIHCKHAAQQAELCQRFEGSLTVQGTFALQEIRMLAVRNAYSAGSEGVSVVVALSIVASSASGGTVSTDAIVTPPFSSTLSWNAYSRAGA